MFNVPIWNRCFVHHITWHTLSCSASSADKLIWSHIHTQVYCVYIYIYMHCVVHLQIYTQTCTMCKHIQTNPQDLESMLRHLPVQLSQDVGRRFHKSAQGRKRIPPKSATSRRAPIKTTWSLKFPDFAKSRKSGWPSWPPARTKIKKI